MDGGFFRLLVKLAGLGSFCGGPLYLSDLLRDQLGQQVAFGVGFAPLALLLLGLLTVHEEPERGAFARAVAGLGLLGGVGLLGVDLFALWELLVAGAGHPNRTMITGGSLIGVLVVLHYLVVAVPYVLDEVEPS